MAMKSQAKKLSVVLAVRNEEAFIGECLKSVQGWVDEIIVVDEFSTDKTVDIAKGYGAKVYQESHETIFHVTKNKAIKRATGKWVLQLDADERITKALKEEILAVVNGTSFGFDSWQSSLRKKISRNLPNKLSEPAAAYWIPRRNNFLGRYLLHTGQYPDPAIRLFQNGKAILPAKDVHEFMRVDGQVGWLTGDMLHDASPTMERYLKRENYYSSLEAKLMFERNVKVNFLNTIKYLFLMPVGTFCRLYFRHRGFLDGFPGFVFSLYSGLHHAFSYMKLFEIYKTK